MSPSLEDLTATKALLFRSLTAWGLGSMSVGGALLTAGRRRQSPSLVAAGQQHLIWGATDTLIAAWGRSRADRSASELDVAAQASALRRLLLVNVALDVGYVCAGLALSTSPEKVLARWPERVATGRSTGAAVLVQGAFLLVLDSRAARQLAPK